MDRPGQIGIVPGTYQPVGTHASNVTGFRPSPCKKYSRPLGSGAVLFVLRTLEKALTIISCGVHIRR